MAVTSVTDVMAVEIWALMESKVLQVLQARRGPLRPDHTVTAPSTASAYSGEDNSLNSDEAAKGVS